MDVQTRFCRFITKTLILLMVLQSVPWFELSRTYYWSPEKACQHISRFLSFVGPSEARAESGHENFLIAVDEKSRLYYAKSNGDGTFSDYDQFDYLGGNYSRGVIIDDFNNDGAPDFIAGRGISSTGYYYLFVNDGSNNFSKSHLVGTQSNASDWAMDMASGDFNNDGYMDFLANGNNSTTGIYLGDGTVNFSKTEMDLGTKGRGMDAADFDLDGNLDFVRGRNTSGYIDVYPGNGDGTFGSAVRVGDAGSNPYGVVAGDFNNDGFSDVIANAGDSGNSYFYAGNGDLTFTDPVSVPSIDFNNHGCFDAYDYNGNGNLDIVAVSYTGKRVYFYPGNGDATFGAVVEIGSTSSNTLGISALPVPAPAGTPNSTLR